MACWAPYNGSPTPGMATVSVIYLKCTQKADIGSVDRAFLEGPNALIIGQISDGFGIQVAVGATRQDTIWLFLEITVHVLGVLMLRALL